MTETTRPTCYKCLKKGEQYLNCSFCNYAKYCSRECLDLDLSTHKCNCPGVSQPEGPDTPHLTPEDREQVARDEQACRNLLPLQVLALLAGHALYDRTAVFELATMKADQCVFLMGEEGPFYCIRPRPRYLQPDSSEPVLRSLPHPPVIVLHGKAPVFYLGIKPEKEHALRVGMTRNWILTYMPKREVIDVWVGGRISGCFIGAAKGVNYRELMDERVAILPIERRPLGFTPVHRQLVPHHTVPIPLLFERVHTAPRVMQRLVGTLMRMGITTFSMWRERDELRVKTVKQKDNYFCIRSCYGSSFVEVPIDWFTLSDRAFSQEEKDMEIAYSYTDRVMRVYSSGNLISSIQGI